MYQYIFENQKQNVSYIGFILGIKDDATTKFHLCYFYPCIINEFSVNHVYEFCNHYHVLINQKRIKLQVIGLYLPKKFNWSDIANIINVFNIDILTQITCNKRNEHSDNYLEFFINDNHMNVYDFLHKNTNSDLSKISKINYYFQSNVNLKYLVCICIKT